MPTFTYTGAPLNALILDAASGFDALDFDFNSLSGTNGDNTFDLTGITAFIDASTILMQGGDDLFRGSTLAEDVNGGEGQDTLNGLGGNDTLNGGAGADVIRGGGGNDLIYVGFNDGLVDDIDGGSGMDTVQLGGFDLVGLDLGSGASVEAYDDQFLTTSGTNGNNSFDMSGVGAYISGNSFFLKGGNDSFTGGTQAESIDGGSGDDTIIGGRGKDTITGGLGRDVIDGGRGDDLIIIDGQDGTVDSIQGGAGTDTARTTTSSFAGIDLGLTASVEIFDDQFFTTQGDQAANTFDLRGIQIYFSGNQFLMNRGDDLFEGSDQAESVEGGAGNDTLNGGGGSDTLVGGTGINEINAGEGDDFIVFTGEADGLDVLDGGAGVDTLQINGSSLDRLLLGSGTSIEVVDDFFLGLTGTNADNLFDLSGVQSYNSGNTFLLNGGNDVFIGSDADESVNGGFGDDNLQGGRGRDTLISGGGNDTLDGGRGADLLVSSIYSEDVITFRGGAGNDTVLLQGVELTQLVLDTAAEVEILDDNFLGMRGTSDANLFDLSAVQFYQSSNAFELQQGADTFIGSDLSENVNGGSGADTLTGNGGDDVLSGGSGRDIIDGDAGADVMLGGGGHDSIKGGSGTDTLLGQNGNDTLKGQGDNDRLNGGEGDDILTGGSGEDHFIFDSTFGDDTITDFSDNDNEVIDFRTAGFVSDFTDLITNHLRDNGSGVAEIFDGNGNTLLLQGVLIADVGVGLSYSADDFIFV